MKLQTVINHEIEWSNITPSYHVDYFSIAIDFKIKHSDRVKNNTITLQNLVRSCPEFRERIKDIILHYANFNAMQLAENPGRYHCKGSFSIYPRSSGKGNIYMNMYYIQDVLDDPIAAIDEILGGC